MESKLPKNWVDTELMNLCSVYTGKKDANFATKSGEYNFFTCAYKPLKSDSYSFEGDVLILPGNGVNVGEVFYFSGKFEAYQRTYIINDIKIDPRYLFYHFSRFWRELGSLKQFGSATNYIKIGNFKDYKVQFPPLAEQQRIVAKLDTLFGSLDALKIRLNNIPQLIKNFKQAVLTQAVTGKLTEDLELLNILNEIKIDRKNWYNEKLSYALKNKTKKPKKIILEILEGKEILKNSLFRKYDVAFIEEIAAKKDYALKAGPFGSALKKAFYVPKGYKIYGQEQVIKNDPKYGDYYINEKRFESLKSCEVAAKDVLISLVGTIGRVLVLPLDFERGIINPRLVKISLHEKIIPEYFALYIKSDIAKNIINSMAHGGTMDVINLGILKKLPIPIPSTTEQTEIVKRVENLFSKADAIEKQYKTLKVKINRLPQAILAKAFKGELVAQLPTDGDAKDLLEEIKKLKESLVVKPKKKVVRNKK